MYEYNATIINVVDGDTVDAVIDLGFKMTTTQRLRLLDIDAPEVRGVSMEEKVKGREATSYLSELVLGEVVVVKTAKSDSFGRYLAEIIYNGKSVNQAMLDNGLAVPYQK